MGKAGFAKLNYADLVDGMVNGWPLIALRKLVALPQRKGIMRRARGMLTERNPRLLQRTMNYFAAPSPITTKGAQNAGYAFLGSAGSFR